MGLTSRGLDFPFYYSSANACIRRRNRGEWSSAAHIFLLSKIHKASRKLPHSARSPLRSDNDAALALRSFLLNIICYKADNTVISQTVKTTLAVVSFLCM